MFEPTQLKGQIQKVFQPQGLERALPSGLDTAKGVVYFQARLPGKPDHFNGFIKFEISHGIGDTALGRTGLVALPAVGQKCVKLGQHRIAVKHAKKTAQRVAGGQLDFETQKHQRFGFYAVTVFLQQAVLRAAVETDGRQQRPVYLFGEREHVVAALGGYPPRSVHLILGGLGKGQDFSVLVPSLQVSVAGVYLIGRDAPIIEEAIGGVVPVRDCKTLHDAVDAARAEARPGQVVLLAPGCASFDQFADYGERGRVFAESARTGEGGSCR